MLIFISIEFMKHELHNIEPIMEPYDDENIEHVLAGPDYGQPWGEGWTEESTTDWWLNEWEKKDRELFGDEELVL
jgi:hypothetical protein